MTHDRFDPDPTRRQRDDIFVGCAALVLVLLCLGCIGWALMWLAGAL